MTDIEGPEALVSLFQMQPRNSDCSDQIATTSPSCKPRALTMSAASSTATTYIDTTYRGRFPCGRYHRDRILETSLRHSSMSARSPSLSGSGSGFASSGSSRSSSLSSSAPSDTSPPSTPGHSAHSPTPQVPEHTAAEGTGRLSGLRRLFSYSRKAKEEVTNLKPLMLPNGLGLNRASTTNAAVQTPAAAPSQEPSKQAKNRRRLSLTGWLPLPLPIPIPIPGLANISSPVSSPSDAPTQKPSSGLKPLKLTMASSTDSSLAPVPGPSERANMLAWLLDCIARDIKPHWSVVPLGDDERAKRMVLQDGQARCLVVRKEKRRSALF